MSCSRGEREARWKYEGKNKRERKKTNDWDYSFTWCILRILGDLSYRLAVWVEIINQNQQARIL